MPTQRFLMLAGTASMAARGRAMRTVVKKDTAEPLLVRVVG